MLEEIDIHRIKILETIWDIDKEQCLKKIFKENHSENNQKEVQE